MFELEQPHDFHTADDSGKTSVQILVAIEGCGILEAPGTQPVTLGKGDAVVVPAQPAIPRPPAMAGGILIASVPGKAPPEPVTRM